MARIVYTIGELFGSIGGLTFQRNRSGKTVRMRPTVGKKSTTKQQESHLTHNNLLRGWQLLSLADKNEWNTYADTFTKTNKFGQEKELTGQNWYESINYWRNVLGLSELTTPPAHDLPTSPPTFEILLSPDKILIEFTSSHDYADSPVIVWVTVPTRKISNSINQIRKFALIIDSAPADPLDITTQWETATGLDWSPMIAFPNANIFVCLESVKASSGITSPMICGKVSTTEMPNYNRYTALISQTGVAAPTVKILENTIGTIVWTRSGVGDYLATLAGAFTADKTAIFIGKNFTLSASSISPTDIQTDRIDANSIYLDTVNAAALADGLLNDTPIEIRVYP